jgi:hypothetical protein
MRLLVLYLRSRQVPMAFAAAVPSVAALWAVNLRAAGALLGVLAVLAGVAAAGPGLAGADLDLDRTAALAWPPRRAAHLIAIGATVTGLLAATTLTTSPIAPTAQFIRDTTGMTGLLALGAATLGASRAWIPPLTATLAGWTLLATAHLPPTWRPILTWMFQPANSTTATITAALLAATGGLTYAVLGPRP